MAFADGDLIELALFMNPLGQQTLNVYDYLIEGAATTVSAANVAEAWWNNIKVAYRNLASVDFGPVFKQIKVRNLTVPTGDFGTFAIPPGEQTGLRTSASAGQPMPPFNAGGMQLTVATRVTRPGQKRFPFVCENDNNSGILGGDYLGQLGTIGAIIDHLMTLGAPAALTQLLPIVVRKDASGLPTAHQVITGFLVNPQVTSQNTRKVGRGA